MNRLEARSLRKAVVPLHTPSPASIQSTRLALHLHVSGDSPSCSAYIASGCHLYQVEMSMEDSALIKGKESLLIPEHCEVMDLSVVNRCPHQAEIQSIALKEMDCGSGVIVGTVDSYGHLIVSQIDRSCQEMNRPTYSALPQDSGVGEGSWAGLCFSPNHLSMIAVARSFCKSIDIYDQGIHLKSLHTLWCPSSLCFLSSLSADESSVLAVAEGCQLTIWDMRMKHNGGCVQRVSGSVGNIFYAICSADQNIAVGGSDRTVSIYDPRRWSALSRWANCSKYEITGLAFSSLDSDHIYIQGVDYEVFCGQWKENQKVFSFRGDSNWLGFGKCPGTDALAGWCESGSIFVADVAKERD